MFDRAAIKHRSNEFIGIYDITTDRIHDMCVAKAVHTHNVADNCDFIAKSLGFDDYDVDLAWIIGELHDFARFGQIVATHSFKDTEKFNHARVGTILLFEHGMINDVIPNYDDVREEDGLVMEKAIYHHSGFPPAQRSYQARACVLRSHTRCGSARHI